MHQKLRRDYPQEGDSALAFWQEDKETDAGQRIVDANLAVQRSDATAGVVGFAVVGVHLSYQCVW